MGKIARSIGLILCSGLIILMICLDAWAFGVRPLVIDLDMRPGDTQDFEIILNPGSSEETVLLSLYQPVQLLSGSLAYQEPDPDTFPSVNWVKLDKSEAKVYPGEDTVISGTVKVPFDAGGSHTVVIMAEPRVPTDQPGITFIVRYAIRLNIRVDRPGLRIQGELRSFDMVPGSEGEPVIITRVANTSAWDYLVSGEVTLRDSERRLVERVQLDTETSERSGISETRMYPGSEVEYLGPVTKRLSPGEYTMRVFLRYGDHGQITRTKTIEVVQGQFNFPRADEIGAFDVEPITIEIEAKPGQRKSQVLQVTSEIQEPTVILLGGRDVTPDYPYSPLGWVELRGPAELELPGRGRNRLVLTVAVPKDAADASYNGSLVMAAFAPESDEPITEKTIPLTVLVGKDHIYQVEIRSLQGEQTEGGHVLTLDIVNTGNVDLTPRADLVISNAAGEFVERAVLTLPEDCSKVMPLQSQQLSGIAQGLDAGAYLVKLTIFHGNRDILSTEVPLDIEEQGE
ncbi:MAG: hypothetical protein GX322_00780 [Firmicutes bacterium]|nr:hypothetical protein [Bacillota bacterium]